MAVISWVLFPVMIGVACKGAIALKRAVWG